MTKKKDNKITIRSSAAEYLTFVASIGESLNSFEMRYEDENIWLTQKMIATLYDVKTHTINYHIKKIFNLRNREFSFLNVSFAHGCEYVGGR